ncbi:MAG: ATP-binding cassette domain-containing protein [Clostridiales bacterium]|nr:ATP-binding cassette domain-containing protein [Clostridiales bacterium]
MEILTLKNLSFSYPESDRKAIENISLSVREGEFIVICGRSGCGKTTLLRLLKNELAPVGKREGEILFCRQHAEDIDVKTSAGSIGFVAQNPESQTVTDKVWHELAFGMENLGYDADEMRLRAGELANYFGINGWLHSDTATLSGGQKQLLALASVMALSPKILLLDEPTSQLDPIAASGFINTLQKINRELGMTVILSEHRLEEVFPIADRVVVMDEGKIVCSDEPEKVCGTLAKSPISAGFPSAARIFSGLDGKGKCPLTVREGREFLSSFEKKSLPVEEEKPSDEVAFSMKNVWQRYERNSPDILKGADIEVRRGEIFSLLGGNGSGKTTLISVIAGIEKAYRGKITILGKNIKKYGAELHRGIVAMLPQDVSTVFIKNTVRDDLFDICRAVGCSKDEAGKKIAAICAELSITEVLSRHPYDLSGGEGQRAALAKILLTEPKILLLDEPTKGIDAFAKQTLMAILRRLSEGGVTVFIVTHDTEFAAEISDRCAMLFDGKVISHSCPQRFFGKNNFYTTSASRISRGIFENTVTAEQVIALGKEEIG